jgi:SAM-dependent methyltransferase
MNLQRWFFEWRYAWGKPPWDTNVTPPEVVEYVTNSTTRGRALDLGCGTGTNAIFLAQQGFDVVGVDFSSKAIARARDKAHRAQVTTLTFYVADVTRLDFLDTPFDFVLDIGCLHGVDPARRARYAEHLARLTRSGAMFMLYAFLPAAERSRRLSYFRSVGITPEQVSALFSPPFVLERIQHGTERNVRPSAWYWLRRR